MVMAAPMRGPERHDQPFAEVDHQSFSAPCRVSRGALRRILCAGSFRFPMGEGPLGGAGDKGENLATPGWGIEEEPVWVAAGARG